MTGVTNGGDSNNNWAQLPELHRKILHFLRANEDNGGVYIMDIARGVASTGVSAQQVGYVPVSTLWRHINHTLTDKQLRNFLKKVIYIRRRINTSTPLNMHSFLFHLL